MPSGLLRKLRALSMARPKRARHAVSRSWTSDGMRTSATWSNTSGLTVSSPTSVVPARAPSITWSERSSVNTSESNRGLVMTSVSRSSTLSSMPGSATAVGQVEDLLLEQELFLVVKHRRRMVHRGSSAGGSGAAQVPRQPADGARRLARDAHRQRPLGARRRGGLGWLCGGGRLERRGVVPDVPLGECRVQVPSPRRPSPRTRGSPPWRARGGPPSRAACP